MGIACLARFCYNVAMDIIASAQNKTVKYIRGLHAKKGRDADGVFLVEGVKFVAEITPPWEIEMVCVSQTYARENDVTGFGGQICIVADRVFNTLCDASTPQGLLAVVKQHTHSLDDIVCGENPLIILLENISDPGNLGSILRIAHGLGLSGVVLAGGADVFAPKVVRASAGSIFHVPFVMSAADVAIAAMQARGINVFAAAADGASPIYEANFVRPSAIIIGNEASGISADVLALANKKVSIPVVSESLNASVACGILAYEAKRQRKFQ